MSQQFFVAAGQSLKLPNTNLRWAADPHSGRRIKTGTSGGFLRGSQQLPPDFVDYAKTKKESNGQTLLQNLLDAGTVVLNQGDSAPVDWAPPLPLEREVTQAARPRQD